MIISQVTQPVLTAPSAWGPESVAMIITTIAAVLIPALILLFKAMKDAAAALRQANTATADAGQANVKADANTVRMEGMQQQVTRVAQAVPTVVMMPAPPTPNDPASHS